MPEKTIRRCHLCGRYRREKDMQEQPVEKRDGVVTAWVCNECVEAIDGEGLLIPSPYDTSLLRIQHRGVKRIIKID